MYLKTGYEEWVFAMAEALIVEITQQMAGIQLTNAGSNRWEEDGDDLAIVWGLIKGEDDFNLYLQFRAERRLFYRLTYNMMGSEPDREDIRDYAMEYFNILCGRFVSEFVNQTRMTARFFPVKYVISSRDAMLQREQPLSTLSFLSDEGEQAAFSWTAISTEQLQIMRSGKNGQAQNHGR